MGRRRQGFTMVELLVALALMGIVVFYVTGTFSVNQKAYVVVDQVTETQQNARAISELFERDIRHAGFMVPAGASVCGVDNLNTADLLYLSDADSLNPTGFLSADLGATFGGTNVGPGTNNLSVNSIVLDGDPFYDLDGDGTKESDFQVGGGAIIADLNDPSRGTACGTVTFINVGTDTISVFMNSGVLGPVTGTTQLIAIPAHEYTLNGANQLLRDGMILTQGVEDMQFALFVDVNLNNIVDVNEYLGDGANPDYDARTTNHADAREMRVNVVLLTRSPDPDFSDGQFQVTENRTAVAGNDGFRRRVHSSSARLRNVATKS